jgi:hypothetical protein
MLGVPGRTLQSHFARPQTPAEVLSLNPGIVTSEKLEDIDEKSSIWIGKTAPMKFGSGVEVTSVMKFKVTFDSQEMLLEVLETSTESTGPRIFTSFIDKIMPKVSSSTSMRVSADGVSSDAILELTLPLPGWMPLPRAQLEKAGPPLLEKQLEGDLTVLLERYEEAYRNCVMPVV